MTPSHWLVLFVGIGASVSIGLFLYGVYGIDKMLRQHEEFVREIFREELGRSKKVGCKNFRISGAEYCANCGYHLREHECP